MTRQVCRLWRLAMGLCAMFVLAAGAWTLWNYTASAALERAIARLSAAGLPLSAAQVKPPEAAPGENAAHLLKAAFALLDGLPEHVLELDLDLNELLRIPEAARRATEAASEALELVHRAARLPRCVFQLHYEKGISMEMGHLLSLRRLGRLLAARAVIRSGAEDPAGAAGDLRALFALARSLREEPVLVSQLVRIAIDTMALTALEVVLPRLESVPAALEAIEPDAARGAIAFALRGEIALCALRFLDDDVLEDIDVIVGPVEGAWILRLGWLARPYLKADLARLLGLVQAYAQIAARPYQEAVPAWKTAASEVDRQGGVLVRVYSLNCSRVLLDEAALASRVELARLAALFLEHRRKHGAYPGSLSELETKSPEDPFTGKSFALKLEEGAVVLSSEGDGRIAWRLPKE